MPSVTNQPDYFGQANTPPHSATDTKAPALHVISLPPSPEDSDASDSRREVLIFSGKTHPFDLKCLADFDRLRWDYHAWRYRPCAFRRTRLW
jgi:hypothetical protein